jgi:hypothetical protein
LGGDDVLGYGVVLTLGLSDAELDNITAGTLVIGSDDAAVITVTSDITLPTAADVELLSGNSIFFDGGALDTAGGSTTIGALFYAFVHFVEPGVDVTTGPAAPLQFRAGTTLAFTIDGPAADTGYTQLNVAGQVDLTGASLFLSGAYTPVGGEQFVLVANDGTDAVLGTFNGVAEGTVFFDFFGSGLDATLTYAGGVGGNDVVLIIESGNTAPTADAGGPYFSTDAGSVQLDASASFDAEQDASTLTYLWDLDGDGVFGETLGDRGPETGAITLFDTTGLDPGVYAVPLRVLDDGALTGEATAIVTVVDNDVTPPVIVLGGSIGIESDGETQFFSWDVTDDLGLGSVFTVIEFVDVHGVTSQIYNGTDTARSLNIDGFGVGTYTITVTATDGDNNRPGDQSTSTASRSVVVYDDDVEGPTITFSGPMGPQTVTQAATITWTADDPSGMSIAYTTAYFNGYPGAINYYPAEDPDAPLSGSWQLSDIIDG